MPDTDCFLIAWNANDNGGTDVLVSKWSENLHDTKIIANVTLDQKQLEPDNGTLIFFPFRNIEQLRSVTIRDTNGSLRSVPLSETMSADKIRYLCLDLAIHHFLGF